MPCLEFEMPIGDDATDMPSEYTQQDFMPAYLDAGLSSCKAPSFEFERVRRFKCLLVPASQVLMPLRSAYEASPYSAHLVSDKVRGVSKLHREQLI